MNKYIDAEKLKAHIQYLIRKDNYELFDVPELLSFIDSLQQEQPNNMIQWTGNNLKEVINFTGKSPRFGEWFKSWEEYKNYVHTHNDILKLFCEDGSHYEVPVGAWIVKTPDGYNVPSVAKYIHQKQPEVDLEKEMDKFYGIYRDENGMAYDCETHLRCLDWKDDEDEDQKLPLARHFYELDRARKEESVSIAESPSKTFPRVNEFDCGSSYRH